MCEENVTFSKNCYQFLCLASGEPPICMGHVVVDAIRMAIQASRQDSSYDTKCFLDIRKYMSNSDIFIPIRKPRSTELKIRSWSSKLIIIMK